MRYDVVIAGASIAGCTAATVYGRAGLRVALVERNRSMDAHKALCGHFVLGGTQPTLRRLGLWDAMVDAGAAVSSTMGVWADGEWMVFPEGAAPPAISLRRQRLDPMLRTMAAATPGVDLLLGHAVTDVVRDGDAVVGVEVTTATGARRRLLGRLVVGADGHRSPVATLAGVPIDEAPNGRALFWAYYRDVDVRGPGDGQVWLLDPDGAVCDRTDDGLVQIGVFPAKAGVAEFRDDRLGAYERAIAALPDGPSLARATRASKVFGTTDYPCVRRDPTPLPGLALIGDAATASDPVPAVGCGWAFRTAEWLADATIPALVEGGDVARGLRAYRRACRVVRRYDDIGRADARALPPNALQRAVRRAAARDPEVARRVSLFANRAAPPSVLLNPGVVARSLLVRRRRQAYIASISSA
jgi:2-polyprenyl-6-methoxyphenol hydroxylase-like FAD-dependent oxidoreductase